MFLSDLLSQMSVIFGKPGEVPCRSWKELLEGNCRTHSSRGANNGEKGEEGWEEAAHHCGDPGTEAWQAYWPIKDASYTSQP